MELALGGQGLIQIKAYTACKAMKIRLTVDLNQEDRRILSGLHDKRNRLTHADFKILVMQLLDIQIEDLKAGRNIGNENLQSHLRKALRNHSQ